jgi:hypothetical protein
MTIASEITRLQWAKASAKASIENKWVTVPANATVDTYHTYIDQIENRWAWMSHLATPTASLAKSVLSSELPPKSWEYNWNAYGVSSFYQYSSGETTEGIFVCKIIPSTWIVWASQTWYPITYWSLVRPQGTNRKPDAWSVWRNADSSSAYAFLFFLHPSDGTYCLRFTWDTSSMDISYSSLVGWDYEDYDATNYWFDLTWYTEVTSSSWADSVPLSRSGNYTYYSFNIKD